MRVLHFFEHVTESLDSSDVRFFMFANPFVGPGEDGDAPDDLFFRASPMALDDLVGAPSGVCPDEPEEQEAKEQYGKSETY